MQLLGVAIFTPIVSWIGRRIVLASGEPVISNFDIAAFALSPTGIAFVLVIAALSVSLLLAELAGQSWIAGLAIAGIASPVWSAVAFVLRLLPRLILLSARVFLRLLLLALPFLAAAAVIWFTMLGGHDINYYLAEHPPEWQRAKLIAVLLVAAYALLAAWQLARWLYGARPRLHRRVTRARPRRQRGCDAWPGGADRRCRCCCGGCCSPRRRSRSPGRFARYPTQDSTGPASTCAACCRSSPCISS
jgi:glycerophosphoryl diester phosphodiesterase